MVGSLFDVVEIGLVVLGRAEVADLGMQARREVPVVREKRQRRLEWPLTGRDGTRAPGTGPRSNRAEQFLSEKSVVWRSHCRGAAQERVREDGGNAPVLWSRATQRPFPAEKEGRLPCIDQLFAEEEAEMKEDRSREERQEFEKTPHGRVRDDEAGSEVWDGYAGRG